MEDKPSVVKFPDIGLAIEAHCNTDLETAAKNREQNKHWPTVKWGVPKYPCAIVGAGPSVKKALPVLREWKGDIFAVNDMAGYLSDEGIPSYLFMIDCAPEPVKNGKLIKGAVLASRCHPNQFVHPYTRTFDVIEDDPEGINGGPSAMSRGFLLFLKMGYEGLVFFGCDSCFYKEPHVTGNTNDDMNKLMIIKANGTEYITNLPLMLQSNYMAPILREYKHLVVNASGGLLQAMTDHPDWKIVAVSKEIKDAYGDKADKVWGTRYPIVEERIYCGK